jgi:hypothetical protein
MAIPRNLANIAPHVNASSTELVVNDGGANFDFRVEGDTDANLLVVDASTDRVGIGIAAPSAPFQMAKSGYFRLGDDTWFHTIQSGTGNSSFDFTSNAGQGDAATAPIMKFFIGTVGGITERARITGAGDLLIGMTASSDSTAGVRAFQTGTITATRNGDATGVFNRLTNDGTIISIRQDTTEEGTISVSGTTVSYNGGNLSRWAQMLTKPDLLKGTVMSNLDEMNVYVKPTLYWTEEDELPVDEEGNPTVAVGDLKQETSVSENEQLNKVKVSDVEGDFNVAGVFVNWTYDEAHQVDEINMAMTGDMIIRIAQGVTVARGDLLMSAGDGTAKPQGDDIVRSKTIAKVTSTHVTCTYEDGSYCVPCVLMAC